MKTDDVLKYMLISLNPAFSCRHYEGHLLRLVGAILSLGKPVRIIDQVKISYFILMMYFIYIYPLKQDE